MVVAGLGIGGCTATGSHPTGFSTARPPATRPAPTRAATLTSFRSCADALAGLRAATEKYGGSYGVPQKFPVNGAPVALPAAGAASAAASGASASPGAAPAYSGTNVATPGVDEPDMVKTDGRRIVTLEGGVLTVVDTATRHVTGRLQLPVSGSGVYPGAYGGASAGGPPVGIASAPAVINSGSLLLSGDHALVLEDGYPTGIQPAADSSRTLLYLVDLTGQPTIISTYSISGSMLDARQVGSVVRVVTQTQPRILYPPTKARIASAPVSAWLPQYSSTGGGATFTGEVPCTSVSRPEVISGTSLLSVETFDLSSTMLGTGDPVSIEADGDTVYGTADSLYIASGNQWAWNGGGAGAAGTAGGAASGVSGIRQETQIYRFALQGSAPPRFLASGTVPGYLVDQYALSEWNGYLRVATTTGLSWAIADGTPSRAAASAPASSGVYVLSTSGSMMEVVGKLTGLGSSERIYSVRYEGPVGYVVTFRQTDPLYTVDLSDPAHPRLVGQLALTGYSAYLHPASATELIGIGQAADSVGHIEGLQVSLFDVSNPAAPSRLATYALAGARSAAEFDPHAFLYWPASGLIVVPLDNSGDLVLRINGSGFTKVGLLTQPSAGYATMERSLVIGQTLWTLSTTDLMASDLTTLYEEALIPE
jgi:Beta propeller domain